MRSLDEVIQIIDGLKYPPCDDCCVKCYKDNCYLIDALHYLKELHQAQERVIERNRYPKAEDEPLTWDEILQMKGQPIWIDLLKRDYGYWTVIQDAGKMMDGTKCFCNNSEFFWYDDMGKKWNAYTKEMK